MRLRNHVRTTLGGTLHTIKTDFKGKRYGEKVFARNCEDCGAPLHWVWSSRPVYHNDYEDYWKLEVHENRDCIKYLRTLIRELQK